MERPTTKMTSLSQMVTIAVISLGTLVHPHGIVGAEQDPIERIRSRTFPSVFQAWSPADNLPDEPKEKTTARHDLIWQSPRFFGLEWNNRFCGLGDAFTSRSIQRARALRARLLKLNPNIILIAEIRYRDAYARYLPESHEWWLHDEHQRIALGWEEGGFLRLDFHNPQFRGHVAKQAQAAIASGVVDGVMLDWWSDDASRLALVQEVRAAVGDGALIIVNANDRKTPRTAPYVNGYFMECYRSKTAADWRRIADTLSWAEQHLRPPRVNCVETWYHASRNDLHLMRATTTLALTRSDGYCLFSDPNPLPTGDHRHDWYSFWNKSLGQPVAKGVKRPDGAWWREFDHGTAVYNPMGNGQVTISFDRPRISAATGKTSRQYQLQSPDGGIFLRRDKPRPEARFSGIVPPHAAPSHRRPAPLEGAP